MSIQTHSTGAFRTYAGYESVISSRSLIVGSRPPKNESCPAGAGLGSNRLPAAKTETVTTAIAAIPDSVATLIYGP